MMAKSLKNKVVVITGGAVGIGSEIADNFLEHGAKVAVILDIDEKQGTETVKMLNSKHGANKSIFLKCDVTRDLELISKKIIDTYQYVDVLVNNAGIVDELNPRRGIDVNVTSVIEWSLKFWQHMRQDEGGHGGTILNVASIYGYRVDPYIPVYQASKFAVMGFTRTLGHAYNYEKTGVRIIAINPGFTDTNLTKGVKTLPDKNRQEDFNNYVEIQLWQEPNAVGKAAVEIFGRAESGSAWLIEGSKPIVEVKWAPCDS